MAAVLIAPEAALVERWLAGVAPIEVVDTAAVAVARNAVREAAARAGLERVEAESLVTVASELAHNQLRHATSGVLAVRPVEREGIAGVEVIAADRGPGITDPRQALSAPPPFAPDAPPPSSAGLGVGLSSARRLADELDLDVRLGVGTCVRARKFVEPPPQRSEVGVLARTCAGGRVLGDDAAFFREGTELRVAVADGLGHGAEANLASSLAVEKALEGRWVDPAKQLLAIDEALENTRGAVMALCRLDLLAGELVFAGLGDVAVQLCRRAQGRRLGGVPGVLGARMPGRRTPRVERLPVERGELLVVFTDGLRSEASRMLLDRPELLREHPVVVAQTLLETCAREDDDALVLVTRF